MIKEAGLFDLRHDALAVFNYALSGNAVRVMDGETVIGYVVEPDFFDRMINEVGVPHGWLYRDGDGWGSPVKAADARQVRVRRQGDSSILGCEMARIAVAIYGDAWRDALGRELGVSSHVVGGRKGWAYRSDARRGLDKGMVPMPRKPERMLKSLCERVGLDWRGF